MAADPVVVVAVPAADTCRQVQDRLVTWSAAGLLRPVVWWDVDSGKAVAVSAGTCEATTLGEALGELGGGLDVVGFYPHGLQAAVDAGFARRFQEALRGQVLPVLPAGITFAPNTYLLFAPASWQQRVPPALVTPSLTNIISVPEDRPAPRGANLLVENPSWFAAHAAQALATLCGLWADSAPAGSPPLRGALTAYPMPDGGLRLAQTFTRIVEIGPLADHVAERALRLPDRWPNPDPTAFDIGEVRPDLGRYLVDAFMREYDDVLGRRAIIAPTYPEKKYGIVEALLEFLRELWALIRNKPREWVEKVQRTAYNTAADWVEKRTGKRVRRWREADEAAQDLSTPLAAPEVTPDGAVGPAWKDLCGIVIGLVDGTALPPYVEERSLRTPTGRRLAVADPKLVVPDPKFRAPVPGGVGNRACDPLDMDPDLHPDLVPDTRMSVLALLAQLRSTFVWQVGLRLASNLRSAHGATAAAEQDAARLAEEDAAQVGDQAESSAQKATEPARRFRRAVLGVLAAALVAVGIVVAAAFTQPWYVTALVLLLAPLGWFAVLLLTAVKAVRWRAAAEAALGRTALRRVWKKEVLPPLLRQDADRLRRRYEEYLDWAEITGWWSHHPWTPPPYSSPTGMSSPPAGLPPSVVRAVARVEPDSLLRLEAHAQATLFPRGWLHTEADHIIEDAATAYQRLVEHRPDPQPGLANPYQDTLKGPDSLRGYVLRASRAEADRLRRADRLEQRLTRALQSVRLLDVFSEVVPLAPDEAAASVPGTLGPAAGWTSAPEDLREAAYRLRPSVVRVEKHEGGQTWSGSGVVVGRDGLVVTNGHVVGFRAGPVAVHIEGRAAAQPGEVVKVSDTTDLALIRVEGETALTAVELSDLEVVQGQPVVTLGYPFSLEGDPTLAWGLVGAVHRQITLDDEAEERYRHLNVIQMTYPTGGGASGSGVFDMQGQLVGINTAAEVRRNDAQARYISFAIPSRDVAALLGTAGEAADGWGAELERDDGRAVSLIDFLAAIRPGPKEPVFGPDYLSQPTRADPEHLTVIGADTLDVQDMTMPLTPGRSLTLTRSVTVFSRQYPATHLR